MKSKCIVYDQRKRHLYIREYLCIMDESIVSCINNRNAVLSLAMRKSILVDRKWAGFIAVILMGISIFYTMNALPVYRERVDLAISSCINSNHGCDQKHLETISRNRKINTWLWKALILVVLMISYLIFNTL